eukprot:138928-Prymnesium_polylepis.2
MLTYARQGWNGIGLAAAANWHVRRSRFTALQGSAVTTPPCKRETGALTLAACYHPPVQQYRGP